jgi:hypothetical protein
LWKLNSNRYDSDSILIIWLPRDGTEIQAENTGNFSDF